MTGYGKREGGIGVALKLTLVTGRTLAQAAAMHKGKMTEAYDRATSLAEINGDDLAELGLADGEEATVRSGAGSVRVVLKASDLPRGMLFLPMGRRANGLIGAETEGTGMPAFKGLAVEVEP